MSKLALAAAFAAMAVVTFSGSAFAEGDARCAAHQKMVSLLSKKYSEAPMGIGTVNQDRVMQIFVSAKGSWTIVVTKTDGLSCIVAAGQNWENIPSHLSALDPAA